MKARLFSKIIIFFLVSTVLIFEFISCSTGLGESVDLEPPTLKITSPIHGSFQSKNVKIEGTATDNRKISSVEVTYKYTYKGQNFSGSKNANISGSDKNVNWSCDFTFENDCEVEFEAYAYDNLKNGSDYSHDRIMILIDSENPSINKLSIVRGNYVSKLLPIEEFTKSGGRTELKDQVQNKDYFQNEEFTIVADLKDNYGIYEALIDLYLVNPTTKEETLLHETIEPDSTDNLYYPEFTISPEKISELNSLAKGTVHYIKPHLRAKDEATNSASRNDDGVLAWYPEYNTPHVIFSGLDSTTGSITVQQGSPVPILIFDDDDLQFIGYEVVKKSKFTNKESVSLTTKWGGLGTTVERIRDYSFEIDTETIEDGMYYLVMKICDQSKHSESEYYFKEIPLKITNSDAPLIVVDSPTENSTPDISGDGKSFTISGKVIDNQPVSDIAIAWIPNGNDGTSIAEEFFNGTYNFNEDTTYSGIKIYKLTAEAAQDYNSTKKSNAWEKTFDFFEDFKIDGTLTNEAKVFMIATRDQTYNVTTKTFRMNRFTTAPKFIISYLDEGKDTPTVTTNPLITHECKKVKFIITATSENGMPLTAFSVTDTDKNQILHNQTFSDSTKEATYEYTENTPTAGKIMNWEISATDKLNSTTTQSLTIQFDELGTLTSVTCTRNSGTIFTKGEEIKLQANFSGQVNVNYKNDSQKPYIQLSRGNSGSDYFRDKSGNAIDDEDRRAYYSSGSGSNTLYFTYTVPEDIEATNLQIPLSETIVPNGATIEGDISTTLGGGNDTINSNNYAIDSIAPYIVSTSPSLGGVVAKADGKVQIQLTFNEKVNVESGTIVMQRSDSDWYIPPVLSEDVFIKIWNASTAQNREYLCSSSTTTFVHGRDFNNVETLIAKGPYMLYTNGLTEKSKSDDTMIPDLETKYVLAYEYDINKTDGVEANLRAALEAVNYHKAEFEATVLSGSGTNTLTLEVKDSDFIGGLVNGVQYKLAISDQAFYDDAYNYYEGGTDDAVYINGGNTAYTFWVGPVATPVIRVNRKATNDSAEDISNPNRYENQPEKIAKTSFKIDCETPAVSVKYGIYDKYIKGNTTTNNNYTTRTRIKDAKKDEIIEALTEKADRVAAVQGTVKIFKTNATLTLNGSSSDIEIGDGLGDTCQKIYMVAEASKTGFAPSTGYEGAFKTVLDYVFSGGNLTINSNPTKNPDAGFIIYGSQVPEGASYTAGWPLTQTGSNRTDYQLAYRISEKQYRWVSWQILDYYTIHTYTNEYQYPADTEGAFGSFVYAYNKAYTNTKFGEWFQEWDSNITTY